MLKHPDKTYIGSIERGFDFLGNHFSTEGITVSISTLGRVERLFYAVGNVRSGSKSDERGIAGEVRT